MLEFNVGELATRLRAALGVRGAMPLGLDEHCIPTVATADVTGPPFRRIPVRFNITADGVMATAGSPSICYLTGPLGTVGGPSGLQGIGVLDSIQVQEKSFTNATGAEVAKARTVSWSYARFTTPLSGGQVNLLGQGQSLENYGTDGTAPAVTLVGVSAARAKAVAQPAYFGGGPFWMTGQGNSEIIPCQIPLFEAYGIAFVSDFLASATETSRVLVNASGLWYSTGTF
jgi:hypothetical protein